MTLTAVLLPAILLGGHATHPAPKVKIKDIKVGTGPKAKVGDNVTVDYTGTLTNGTKFDSSIGKAPYHFQLGGGQVIKGWDLGVVGMKVGGTRKLTIPPELGYGDQGAGGGQIPPRATLIFTVKMLKIEKG
jgi:FKBP-type peptidyl-prolyl cis-trans isomerase